MLVQVLHRTGNINFIMIDSPSHTILPWCVGKRLEKRFLFRDQKWLRMDLSDRLFRRALLLCRSFVPAFVFCSMFAVAFQLFIQWKLASCLSGGKLFHSCWLDFQETSEKRRGTLRFLRWEK